MRYVCILQFRDTLYRDMHLIEKRLGAIAGKRSEIDGLDCFAYNYASPPAMHMLKQWEKHRKHEVLIRDIHADVDGELLRLFKP